MFATCCTAVRSYVPLTVCMQHLLLRSCWLLWSCALSLTSHHNCYSCAGDDTTGSNSFFCAARLLLRWLWDCVVFCFWVPSKFGIQVGVKLLLVAAVVLVLPPLSAGCGLVTAGLVIHATVLATLLTAWFVIPVLMLMLLKPELLQQPSRQPGGQMSPPRQPQSPTVPDTPLPQQMGSSRQSQTQATPPLRSPAPATDPFFTIPDGADQPLIQALLASRRAFIEQQAAILAAAHRHRGSHPGPTPAGTHEGGSSAAGPSVSAAASAVPLSMPAAGRISTNRSRTANEREDQPADVCVVCMDADKDWFCLPCRHLAMCETCIIRIIRTTRRCPICQQSITKAVQVYRV